MDEAKDGVIYFSLGSNLPVHIFPKEFTQIFINVFKKLPQRVLWKNEAETLPGLPENVKLVKWVPQIGVIGKYSKNSLNQNKFLFKIFRLSTFIGLLMKFVPNTAPN